jgi:hypothetical protein
MGDHVVLRWTTPSRTTDDMDIKSPMTAEICRETENRPSTPAAKLAPCPPVHRLTVVPGLSEVTDTLPPALQADPVRLLTYRIQIFNSTGHSAGNSTIAAYAAAGQAPPEVNQLQAHAAEQGAILEWSGEGQRAAGPSASPADIVDLKRVDLSATPPSQKKNMPPASKPPGRNSGKSKSAQPKQTDREPPNEIHLRAPDIGAGSKRDTAGTVDTTAAMGDTYTYAAQRVRAVTIGNRNLEIASQTSAPVTLVMRDTFPPKPPTGLATIPGNTPPDPAVPGTKPQPYIDLSWEPNSEADLAGYRVYRQLARPDGSPQGPLARLTALPIPVPAYRDVAVRPGQGYIYTVTAVDATGNESAPSAKATDFVSEVPSPDAGGPPH